MAGTVLIVKDEKAIRELLRRYLERAGYGGLTTGAGAEALAVLQTGGVDLTALDLGLPDLDGIEVLRAARVDADRLHQAIGNPLDNAARYCSPHDTVTVAVRAADGRALVEVADSGPGVPAEDLPPVFERLWRGRSGARVSGSGIGLAMVRELVTAHFRPGGGATFTISLPRTNRGDHHEHA